MPALVVMTLSHIDVVLQSENGTLRMAPAPPQGEEDCEPIKAGKQPVTLLRGAAFFLREGSFAMMRGGHLDIGDIVEGLSHAELRRLIGLPITRNTP
jgi:acyl CoA:acetate/3-ketoacid CoA transferase beta subunit